MENNTAIMENNTTVTGNNTAVTGNNKALIENNTAISENNTGVTDNGTVVTGNDTEVIKSNPTISENNKAVTDRCTVVAGNDTVAIENNTGLTDRNTAVAQDIEKRTDMEKQSSETKRDTNLISSFSNLTVTDPTSVENPEIQKEGKLKCTENADPKLLTANAKEDRKADSHIQPAVGNDLKGETGAVSNNKACGAWHSEGNTKQAHDRLLDLKVNEAGGDSGIVLDGEASEATFPKTTCEDLPNQSRYEQESTTENIANFSSETVPKTIDSEATNTVLVQKVVLTKEDTGEIASENVMDTVDQSHFTQQMSTLSMDEGVQGDNEKVQQQILQEVKKQAGLQQLSEKRQQEQEQHHGQQYGQQQQQQDGQHQLGHLHHHQQQQQQQQPYEQTPHGQQQQQQKQQQHHQRYHHQQYSPCLQNQQHLLMKNLQEPQMASGSSQISSPQDYVNTFSRFDSPQIGGAGAVNVFSGGHLTVGSLSINPPPQTSPGIAVPLSTVFEGDGVIIYTDDDYDIAIGFKEHLENDFPSLDIKVDLFDLIDVNLTLYASLETVLYKYRFVFIIITANLNKDKVKSRANEDFQESTFHEEWKRDRIIPVHVFPLKDSKKFCPMMFRSVKGMQYYQRKSTGYAKKMYEDSVKMQIQRVREKSREWEAMIIKEHKNKRSQS